jgi:hypothetical protein
MSPRQSFRVAVFGIWSAVATPPKTTAIMARTMGFMPASLADPQG